MERKEFDGTPRMSAMAQADLPLLFSPLLSLSLPRLLSQRTTKVRILSHDINLVFSSCL